MLIETLNSNKTNYLSVKDLFIVQSGKIIPKTKMINDAKYPIYSAQTLNNGEIGKINTYDFDGEYITWTMYGQAGTVFYRNDKFSITHLCGILKNNNQLVDTKFVYHYLKLNAPKYSLIGSGRSTLLIGEFSKIKIPIIPIYKQKEIAYKLDKFEKYINEINGLLPKEIKLINKQYNYYIDELLNLE
ncbi:restriction endonuclease subunit S [Mycoplasmopsis columbina]|uniref:restriction endonuclease subunit S n=1 Tax=Mycoplasmopsis columbina TaxID=114881 RepID=UPI0006912FA7|nr:restriction endonuclease subunit S [Mycoplasmopsis columbina]